MKGRVNSLISTNRETREEYLLIRVEYPKESMGVARMGVQRGKEKLIMPWVKEWSLMQGNKTKV
jgi:hypothetical protein